MRHMGKAVEKPSAQVPEGKRADQQRGHCQGIARDLDGPRGAQSGLLDDRGGRSSSCGHGFIHDDPGGLVDIPEHRGNQSKAQNVHN